MAIDLVTQQTLSLNAASRTLLPQIGGHPVSPATLHRWVRRGALAGDGTRVRLAAVRVGRAFLTTEESVRTFLNELSRRSGVKPRTAQPPERLQCELKQAGLL